MLMELILKNAAPHQWAGINRARKYFKVYFVSQILLGDGTTVDKDKLNPGHRAD